MHKTIIFFVALLVTIPMFGQEMSSQQKKKLVKELKKEQKAEEAANKAAMVNFMVTHGRFVLEADQLRDKRGNSVNVSPALNFIACDSINGVIQIGSNGYVGLNGVGGITVEGPVSNYRDTRNAKNGSHSITYMVRTSSGTYNVRVNVMAEGRADAVVSSNWPGRINYLGYMVPLTLSKVYKGTTSY